MTHLLMMTYHHTKFGHKRFSSSVSHNTELLSNVLLHYCRYFGIKDFVAKKVNLILGCVQTQSVQLGNQQANIIRHQLVL